MNKQELINRVTALPYKNYKYNSYIELKRVLGLLEQLDEPQKPVIPQFVADWIEHTKKENYHIFGAIQATESDDKLDDWIWNDDNMEVFARAWLDGYEIEKEKRYFVKLKAVDQYLVRNEDENFLGFLQSRLKSKFTRKQLEQAELGWVFDCPGVEIEEVQDDSKVYSVGQRNTNNARCSFDRF